MLGPVGTVPFTRLFVQRTRITELEIPAASVTTLEDGAVVVDFGKIYAARPIVEFHSGIAGRMISMHVGYVLDPDGHVSTTNDTQADEPRVLLHRARRFAEIRALYLPGLPIPRDRRARRDHRARAGDRHRTSLHAARRSRPPASALRTRVSTPFGTFARAQACT